MINTILQGVVNVAMSVLDWFLSPIFTAINDIDLGNSLTVGQLLVEWLKVCNRVRGILPWVIDLTGIPRTMIKFIILIFMAILVLKLSVFVIKMIVKWWDRIVA